MLAEAPPKLTPKKAHAGEWRPAFIAALRNSANVRAACLAANVSRPVAYAHRDRSPEFAAAWDNAMEEACDVLEAAARQRALASSDTLLIFLLKGHRPEKYRETLRQEHTGANGAPISVTFKVHQAPDGELP